MTFLGTGTSFGIPVIGCDCAVCRSPDPRNRRARHALLLEEGGRRLLVDTPPELRLQLVDAGVRTVDAVFLTHQHADHTHGLDDLRIFSMRAGRALPVHVAAEFEEVLRQRFTYIWGREGAAEEWTAVPDLDLRPFEEGDTVRAAGLTLAPVALPHGSGRSYGFRVGDLAVVVDAKSIPERAVRVLAGARVLVINALWFGNPHPSHFNVDEAVEAARTLGVERAYLTHMSHRLDHAELEARLPEGIHAAHDGLQVDV